MGESGIVFVLVPIGYGIAFITLLFAAIVVAFVPRWRFLSAYFVGAAFATVPGFVLWLPCFYVCDRLATIAEKNNLYIAGTAVWFPLMLGTLAAAIVCLALSAFVSAKIVYRWRHDGWL